MTRYLIALGILCGALAGCATHYSRTTGSGQTVLVLRRPQAGRVQLAASVDGYRLHDASRCLFGAWTVRVPAAGEFQYFYVVDGTVYRPDCRYRQIDDFGSQNCIHQP